MQGKLLSLEKVLRNILERSNNFLSVAVLMAATLFLYGARPRLAKRKLIFYEI